MILEVVNLTPATGLQLENPAQALFLVQIRKSNVCQVMEKGYEQAHSGKEVLEIWGTTSPCTFKLLLKISQLYILPIAKCNVKIRTIWIAAVLIADSTLGVPDGLPRHMLDQFAIHFRSFLSTCCIRGDVRIRSKIQDGRK